MTNDVKDSEQNE